MVNGKEATPSRSVVALMPVGSSFTFGIATALKELPYSATFCSKLPPARLGAKAAEGAILVNTPLRCTAPPLAVAILTRARKTAPISTMDGGGMTIAALAGVVSGTIVIEVGTYVKAFIADVTQNSFCFSRGQVVMPVGIVMAGSANKGDKAMSDTINPKDVGISVKDSHVKPVTLNVTASDLPGIEVMSPQLNIISRMPINKHPKFLNILCVSARALGGDTMLPLYCATLKRAIPTPACAK
mmetsp:Transcript_19514/g.34801  ORF Transcript_19514/g.34801 Transcript_19514/m.34801 type:complete len:242 (-) Transcript_19514:880-1605(-)